VAVRANIPEGSPHRGMWIGGSGGAWWWHSAYDTLDKGDRGNLLRDMRMEALAVLRSVNHDVLPFDLAQVAGEYEEVVTGIQTRAASGTFNLSPVLDRIREMKSSAERLNEAVATLGNIEVEKASRLNGLLMKASRTLTSTLYTYEGRYDQDPAYGLPPLPALQRATELAGLPKGGDEEGFLRTRLVREMNKVCSRLETAIRLIVEAVGEAGGAT
ncbi:MAG: hypothetical protein OEZ44_09790, partial [Candidatus Bathyarchaeota archaeon]|nr:hypothetical protein [Candidatus Bathyarchaeota archaeon]